MKGAGLIDWHMAQGPYDFPISLLELLTLSTHIPIRKATLQYPTQDVGSFHMCVHV